MRMSTTFYEARRSQGSPDSPRSPFCSRSTFRKRSGPLHAQIAKSFDDLWIIALDSVKTVAGETATRINRMAPVDRLTDDTLVYILMHLDNRTTFFTTKVSRRWRNLALSTPGLWTSIDLSCCPREFERRFRLFVEQSQISPLDIKLIMESTEVDAEQVRKNYEILWEFFSEHCAEDLSEQLKHRIRRLVLVPNVLVRLRSLDITSTLTADNEYGSSEIKQPTPTLQLPASSSLQRLRLNWARPHEHELHLVLDPKMGAFDSVSSLALCAVDNLREVLPRFPRVVDLSLWLGQPQDSEFQGIQLAEICEWMARLSKLEVAEVPQNFASKTLAAPPSLHRLFLHGKFAGDVLNAIAAQMDLEAVLDIGLWNSTRDVLISDIISALSEPAVELSVHDCPPSSHTDSCYHFCAADGLGRHRIFHGSYDSYYYQCDDDSEIISNETINTNMDMLFNVLPKAMPRLETLRIRLGGFQRDNSRVSQLSCPALVHLELFSLNGDVTSGADVTNWITSHLKDFSQPLKTLLVTGVRLGSDIGVLDRLASTVSCAPISLFE